MNRMISPSKKLTILLFGVHMWVSVNGGEFYLLYRTQILFCTIKVNGNSGFRTLFSFAAKYYSFDTSRRTVGRRAFCVFVYTHTLTRAWCTNSRCRDATNKTGLTIYFFSFWNIWIMSQCSLLSMERIFIFSFCIFFFLSYARFVASQFISKMYHSSLQTRKNSLTLNWRHTGMKWTI